MVSALKAGVLYFVIVFAIGFALGVLRVLVLVPQFGETSAVLLEIPLILTACWFVSLWLIRRCGVPGGWSPHLAMGAVALALLLMAEIGVSTIFFSRTLAMHVSHYGTLPGAVGLAGQIVYGLFPAIQWRLGRA